MWCGEVVLLTKTAAVAAAALAAEWGTWCGPAGCAGCAGCGRGAEGARGGEGGRSSPLISPSPLAEPSGTFKRHDKQNTVNISFLLIICCVTMHRIFVFAYSHFFIFVRVSRKNEAFSSRHENDFDLPCTC